MSAYTRFGFECEIASPIFPMACPGTPFPCSRVHVMPPSRDVKMPLPFPPLSRPYVCSSSCHIAAKRICELAGCMTTSIAHNRNRFPLWRISLSRLSAAKPSVVRLSTAGLSIASLAAFLLRVALASFGLLFPTASAVQNPHDAQLVQAKADATKKPEPPPPVIAAVIAPPGADLYIAQRGDSITSVARKYLKRTKYLTSAEVAEAIRAANHNRQGVFLKSGEQIIIPGILESPIVEKSVPVARDFEVRAIYLTGVMAGSDHGERIIRHWREVGGNAVVFDIKDSDGIVNIAFDHPLASG